MDRTYRVGFQEIATLFTRVTHRTSHPYNTVSGIVSGRSLEQKLTIHCLALAHIYADR